MTQKNLSIESISASHKKQISPQMKMTIIIFTFI